ncbi:MAG: polyprenol monophosphomannose synthase [Candidatus Aenigmarchaeota archaeon]|nr:polyprenol monophosphomannose synthase [Candidatus Aenigmarchaeota archaeon]
MKKISIVLPTYNEALNIKNMISDIIKNVPDVFEIIVVDDDSPDRTWEIAKNVKDKRVKVIRRIGRSGVGSAIYEGIHSAKGDIVVWMDADLSMPASLIPEMAEKLDECDVVVGSRYVGDGKDERKFIRVMTSKMINFVADLILAIRIHDYDSGFVAARKEVFKEVDFDPSGHGEYCIEFLYKCVRKGFHVEEIGYRFTERQIGESKTEQYFFSILLHGVKYLSRIVRIRFQVA